MIFVIKRKMDNFDPYNVLLSIATNIPVLLMTAFVLQGHILKMTKRSGNSPAAFILQTHIICILKRCRFVQSVDFW